MNFNFIKIMKLHVLPNNSNIMNEFYDMLLHGSSSRFIKGVAFINCNLHVLVQ